MDYEYKTKPLDHQKKLFEDTWHMPGFGLFWEAGCGKTKPTIDTIAKLYLENKITGVIVVAPNGVHDNWKWDEIPKHMPDAVQEVSEVFAFHSSKASTKKSKIALKECIHHKGLSILLISYGGIMTKAGRDAARKLLDTRDCMFVADESHYLKSPSAKRTKALLAGAKKAKYRRVLSGTPIGTGAFDIYSQIKFIHPNFWKERGIKTFHEFKLTFGVFRPSPFSQIGQLVDYRNIDVLKKYVDMCCSRVTKAEVLDLPDKIYQTVYFEMCPKQWKAYNEIRSLGETQVGNDLVETDLPIVRDLRLQQITCNYLPTGDENNLQPLTEKNPRLAVLKEITDSMYSPAVIWSRFTEDINQICEMLGDKCVRYTGGMDPDERLESKRRFVEGEVQFMVANPAAGAEGNTWVVADTAIYYCNSFDLIKRLQSEERVYRYGQEKKVTIIDIMCKDTICEKVVKALVKKRKLSNELTGDEDSDWIN